MVFVTNFMSESIKPPPNTRKNLGYDKELTLVEDKKEWKHIVQEPKSPQCTTRKKYEDSGTKKTIKEH